MKCICGYEHDTVRDSEKHDYVTTVGDVEFLALEIVAERKKSHNYGGDTIEPQRTFFYACPKCGTIRASMHD